MIKDLAIRAEEASKKYERNVWNYKTTIAKVIKIGKKKLVTTLVQWKNKDRDG